jgi:CheY-like chemotaxis protein
MHQVLLNLVVNARDAMPRGGRLAIATSNADVEEGDPARHPGIAPGHYVLLSVADTGVGIEAEAREHIFDPFFTTKGKGAGTGLGLATVYGIVQQTGGSISFHSESDRGTTFLMHLPRTEAAVSDRRETARSSADLRGAETVLVVEDQDSVRKLAVQILSHCGYRILEAAQGDEALLMAARHAGPIHLMLTDVVMPRMTGRDLAEQLSATRPAMKVLYMSGYAEDVIASRGLLDPGLLYIAKPFASEALALKVREALGSTPGPATATRR